MEHTFAAAVGTILVSAVAVLCAMALAGSFDETKAVSPKEDISVSEPEEPKSMVLGVFDGKLALFIGESPYPNRIFDFLIRTLPQEDQNRLFEGIKISSEEELELLLEDYMS